MCWSVKFLKKKGEAKTWCLQKTTSTETILNIKLKKPSPPSLAFRDYGACLGLKCYASTLVSTNPTKAKKLQALAEEILESWEQGKRHRRGNLDDDEDEDEEEVWLKPITEVMHCAALVPGGESIHIPNLPTYSTHAF